MIMKIQGEVNLKGTPICAGIAIGRPFFFTFIDDVIPDFIIGVDGVDEEILRFRKALKRSRQDIKRLQKQLEVEGALEGAAVLDTHLQMMQDPALTTEIELKIRETRKNTETIFQAVIFDYEKKFNKISDKFFRERFKDIQDIYRRIMGHLRESMRISLADIPQNSIVFAHDLAPSDTAEAKLGCVNAFITEVGGETSHAAIVAKAKGIPFVASVDFESVGSFRGRYVIVDGRTGDIIINPTQQTLTKYRDLQKQLQEQVHDLEEDGTLKAETIDGYSVKLSANVEITNDLDCLHEYNSSGVGLFRSEFMCVAEDAFPSEEEQFEAYRVLVENMRGLPVVIRTFDIGGDKFREFQKTRSETNPFLGCRAIRFLLKEPDIFKVQLRAILRASNYGPVHILFPMISGLPELLEAKKLVKETRQELFSKGIIVSENIKIGCMIEVPSAAITCDLLARESDFLSIGTNDLVQYSLAVDRGNQEMSYLYAPTHPSVLRLIKMVVSEGCRNHIPVSICGEIAADPRYTSLLLGLGVRELSVASRFIPVVKNAIRNTSIVDSCQLAEKVLRMSTAKEIEDLLIDEYQENFPNDFFYNLNEEE